MKREKGHRIFYLGIEILYHIGVSFVPEKKVFMASRRRDKNGNLKMDDVYAYGAFIIIVQCECI